MPTIYGRPSTKRAPPNCQLTASGTKTGGSLAGAEGFEPPLAVLETAGLAVKPMPLLFQLSQPTKLLRFAVRLVLSAVRAELLQFNSLGGRLLVLGVAIVPVLALLALELNNLARHNGVPLLLTD